MPLLTLDELEKSTPRFREKTGNVLCRILMRILADVLQILSDAQFITISNHLYGHIDRIMLVDVFEQPHIDIIHCTTRGVRRMGAATSTG